MGILNVVNGLPHRAGRFVTAWLILAFAAATSAAQPESASLTAVKLAGTNPEETRMALEIRGRVDRVETMDLGDGRFVFDLAPVVWDGPSRRVRPGAPGVIEYRYSQLSRDPPITRFVVESSGGWSCRHEPVPNGLLVICGALRGIEAPETAVLGPVIAVVRGIELLSPVEGLGAEDLIDRSLGYVPRDLVRDGLPNFGAVRDDWLGAPRRHKGLDIYGDDVFVLAAARGKVEGAGEGEKAGGWVKIDHGNGVETVSVHISGLRVRPGDTVASGQRIAVIDGPTGNAVQAQLHFEIKLDGESVDPVPFIFESASQDLKARITEANQKLAVLEKQRAARVRRGID